MPKPDAVQTLAQLFGQQCAPSPLVSPPFVSEPIVIEMGTVLVHSGQVVTLSTSAYPAPYLPLYLEGAPDHPRKDLWITMLKVAHIDLLTQAIRLTTAIGPTPAALAHLAREMSDTLGIPPEDALADLRKRYGPLRLDTGATPIAHVGVSTRIDVHNRRGPRAAPVALRLTLHAMAHR